MASPWTSRKTPDVVPNIVREAARVWRSSLRQVFKTSRRKLKLGVACSRSCWIEILPVAALRSEVPTSTRSNVLEDWSMVTRISSGGDYGLSWCSGVFVVVVLYYSRLKN